MDKPPKERLTLKERVRNLLKLNNTPHEIALGVAIGAFISIMPLYGLHTILVIIAALIIKHVNKIAIVLGTCISTTPTLPFITWAGYNIGRFILGNSYPALNHDIFKHFSYEKFLHLYYPLFLGSVILGLTTSIIFYGLTFWFVTARKKTKLKL